MKRIPFFRFLVLINLFGIALVILRYAFTGVAAYFYLWWNVFLAAIPLGIVLLLEERKTLQKNHFLFIGFAILWLLFLPNAPYMITDLLHITDSHMRYIWFDILLIFTYAISGLCFALISVEKMGAMVDRKAGRIAAITFVSLSLFASGFGVYLGRYHRYNSWDLIQHPQILLQDVAERFIDPFAHPRTWAMTLLIGIFLHIVYFGFRDQIKANKTA